MIAVEVMSKGITVPVIATWSQLRVFPHFRVQVLA